MKESLRDLIAVLILALAMSALAFSSAEAKTEPQIKKIIEMTAIKHGIDPVLAVAIAQVESNLNPDAIGSLGEIGVYQLRPEYHNVKRGDVRHNVETAIKYLADIRRKWQPVYGDAWFIKFNLGPNYRTLNHPEKFPYYVRVMRKKQIYLAGTR